MLAASNVSSLSDTAACSAGSYVEQEVSVKDQLPHTVGNSLSNDRDVAADMTKHGMATQRQKRKSSGDKYVLLAWIVAHLFVVTSLFGINAASTEYVSRFPLWQYVGTIMLLVANITIYGWLQFSDPGFVIPGSISGDNITQQSADVTLEVRRGHDMGDPSLEQFKLLELGEEGEQNQQQFSTTATQKMSKCDIMYGRRYCRDCNVHQPLRTKHCDDCGKCVRRHDHHCQCIGNCVGQGNHRLFFAYVNLQLAVSLALGDICLSGFQPMKNFEVQGWIGDNLLLLICLYAIGFAAAFSGSMVAFHSFLILTNQTSWETLARRRISYLKTLPEGVKPFSASASHNCIDFFIQRPTLNSWKLDTQPTFRREDEAQQASRFRRATERTVRRRPEDSVHEV